MANTLFKQLGSVIKTAIAAESSTRLATETALTTAINTEKGRIDAILAAADADKDTFVEIVALINSVDTTNDNAFAGYVTTNNAAVATKVTANAAISAGTGTKITYDAKGLVTSSAALAATDIPNLDWSKITTGKPTTLSGYGITASSADLSDAVSIVKKATVNGVSNTISDGIGDLRSIVVAAKASAYTLVAADNGTCVSTNSGVTVPANVFAAGNTVVIYNNSASSITITTSAVTAYITGTDATKSSVTLATRGMCSIFFYASNAVALSGDIS